MKRLIGDLSAGAGLEVFASLASKHLDLDVVCVAEITDDRLVLRVISGDRGGFGLHDGYEVALPNGASGLLERAVVVPDTASDGALTRVLGLSTSDVGSYIFVPLHLPDGALYGSLLGLNRRPEPKLGDSYLQTMGMVAELISKVIPEDRRKAEERADVLALFASADLRIAYQPIFEIATKKCIGFEALARFPEELGLTPDVVFNKAKEAELGTELERFALFLAQVNSPQLGDDQFLSVNLSPTTLAALADHVHATALLSRGDVVVELTEHEVVVGYDKLQAALTPVRGKGMRLAVDDAGAGYALLKHIIEVEPEFIKIDIGLVRGVATDAGRAKAVEALVHLADHLNATTIAEGVESEADLMVIESIGDTAAQGFLLGPPSFDYA